MLCPYCKTKELMVDGVDKNGRISYVCWNDRCEKYKQAFMATGEEVTTRIEEEKQEEK